MLAEEFHLCERIQRNVLQLQMLAAQIMLHNPRMKIDAIRPDFDGA